MPRKIPEVCRYCKEIVYIDGLDRYECGHRKRTVDDIDKDSCGMFSLRRPSTHPMKTMSSNDYFEREREAWRHKCGDCVSLGWDKEDECHRCYRHHFSIRPDSRACIYFKEKEALRQERELRRAVAFLESGVYVNVHAALLNMESAIRSVDDPTLKRRMKRVLDSLSKLREDVKTRVSPDQ